MPAAPLLQFVRRGSLPQWDVVGWLFPDTLQGDGRFRLKKTQHPSPLETVDFPGPSRGRRYSGHPH